MKKLPACLLAMLCALSLIACGPKAKDDILHMGLNGEITAIDSTAQIIYVTDGSENLLGEHCAIDCKKAIDSCSILYVDYQTGEPVTIEFSDLTVGDAVILNIYQSQLDRIAQGPVEAEQIQLATQRLS